MSVHVPRGLVITSVALVVAGCGTGGGGTGAAGAGGGAGTESGGARGVGNAGAAGAAGAGNAGAEGGAGVGNAGSAGVAGAGGSAGASGAMPSFVIEPIVRLDPNGRTPLAALAEIETDVLTTVRVELFDGTHRWSRTFTTAGTVHSLPLLGFRAGTTTEVTITIVDAQGNEVSAEPVPVTTEPLPAEFEVMDVRVSQPAMMEPGYVLFDLRHLTDTDEVGYLVIVDETGEVVWFYRHALHVPWGVARFSNGKFYYSSQNDIVEIDVVGAIGTIWHASNVVSLDDPDLTNVPVDSFHHELTEMPDGTLTTLSTELRTVDFFTNEMDLSAPKAPSPVVGDVLVQIDRDGNVVHELSLFDVVDTNRIGYDSLHNFWDYLYRATPGTRDWTHANAAFYVERDDSFVVSLRSQDALVKVDRLTGEPAWILGPHDNWQSPFSDVLLTPLGTAGVDFEWPYHPHAPEVTPEGTLLVFDNGNHRASPPEPKVAPALSTSRAVEYEIDETAMTVRQRWAFAGAPGESFFAAFLGDADWMPTTGNVLVSVGGQLAEADGTPSDDFASSAKVTAIYEVTRSEPPTVVFRLDIRDDVLAPPAGWASYRAQKIADLWP